MRPFLFIISFFILLQTSRAQHTIVYDSADIKTRTFSAEKLKEYKANKDFQYERFKETPKSIWDRFWEWLWGLWERFWQRVFSTEGGRITFKTVLIILAVAVLVFFILKLSGMTKSGLFGRKSGDGLDYSTSEEDIHTINFEEAIQQAINSGNLRLAVRLLYLQSLKQLTDTGLINWQINKTNIAYVQELSGSSYQPAFSNLTLQFESNWYGDVPIDAGEFNSVREQFNQFNRQLV
jgi:hypothetical protein